MQWVSKQKGFTIVELLIVIVVIAILAAISVVAYTGIQNRAKNQQTISAVTTYYKALASYGIDNNALPNYRACLGPETFYTSNPCYIGGSTYTWSSGLNTALTTYISSPTATAAGSASNGSVTGSGVFYDNQGGGTTGYLGFVLFGETTCPSVAGASFHSNGNTALSGNIYCRIRVPTY